jgi:hypothetical protein
MLINTLIQIEAAARSQRRAIPQPQTAFPTLARFFGKVYDDHVAPHGAKRALFEPRRVATPDGYHSTKCVAAGLYALLTQARLAAEDGEVLPTEVTGSTFSYRVLEHGVPIYFVDDEFARAVAATQLPDDFTFGDLNWPQSGMVVGWPTHAVSDTGQSVRVHQGKFSEPRAEPCPEVRVYGQANRRGAANASSAGVGVHRSRKEGSGHSARRPRHQSSGGQE